jgi:hypothetical protein
MEAKYCGLLTAFRQRELLAGKLTKTRTGIQAFLTFSTIPICPPDSLPGF